MHNYDTYGWSGLLRDLFFVGGLCLFLSGLPIRLVWWQWGGLGCFLFLLRGWMNVVLDNLRVVAQEALDQQEIRTERIAECSVTFPSTEHKNA